MPNEFLEKNKMQLFYVSRELYGNKQKLEEWVASNFNDYYFISFFDLISENQSWVE